MTAVKYDRCSADLQVRLIGLIVRQNEIERERRDEQARAETEHERQRVLEDERRYRRDLEASGLEIRESVAEPLEPLQRLPCGADDAAGQTDGARAGDPLCHGNRPLGDARGFGA